MCTLLQFGWSLVGSDIMQIVCRFLKEADATDINRIAEKIRECYPEEAERAMARHVLRQVAARV